MPSDSHTQTLVFYDGGCPLCRAEMSVLQRWDRARRLRLIDVAAPEYNERAWPVSVADMNALLHVRLPDGTWQTGMAATRHIYRTVGRGWMLAFTGWPLLSPVFDRAYAWFARHRIAISTFVGVRRCDDGACRTTNN